MQCLGKADKRAESASTRFQEMVPVGTTRAFGAGITKSAPSKRLSISPPAVIGPSHS